MTIYFNNETHINIEQASQSAMIRTAKHTLKSEGFPFDAEISITIVDDNRIRELNKRFRKIDSATDVLSFPCHSLKSGEYKALESEREPIALGDVIISIQKALYASETYGHTLARELSFLVCHSVLHLLGYDHINDCDKAIMFAKQKKNLDEMGIYK